MTWEYVAGFFDGEGNVKMRGAGNCGSLVTASMAQAGSIGLIVLSQIQDFLQTQGIISKVYSETKLHGTQRQLMHRLYIGRRENVLQFFSKVLPYTRVKKSQVQDVLRYVKIFPQWKASDHKFTWGNGHWTRSKNGYAYRVSP